MGNMKLLAFDLAEQLDQLNRSAKAKTPFEALQILTGQDRQSKEEVFNVGGRLVTMGELDHSYEEPEMVEEEYAE